MLVVYYVCQGEKVNQTDALQGKKQAEKHKDINIEGKKKKQNSQNPDANANAPIRWKKKSISKDKRPQYTKRQ